MEYPAESEDSVSERRRDSGRGLANGLQGTTSLRLPSCCSFCEPELGRPPGGRPPGKRTWDSESSRTGPGSRSGALHLRLFWMWHLWTRYSHAVHRGVRLDTSLHAVPGHKNARRT